MQTLKDWVSEYNFFNVRNNSNLKHLQCQTIIGQVSDMLFVRSPFTLHSYSGAFQKFTNISSGMFGIHFDFPAKQNTALPKFKGASLYFQDINMNSFAIFLTMTQFEKLVDKTLDAAWHAKLLFGQSDKEKLEGELNAMETSISQERQKIYTNMLATRSMPQLISHILQNRHIIRTDAIREIVKGSSISPEGSIPFTENSWKSFLSCIQKMICDQQFEVT